MARQFTIAFTVDVDMAQVLKMLDAFYGRENVEVGHGVHINAIPHNWMVIHNDRPKRLD